MKRDRPSPSCPFLGVVLLAFACAGTTPVAASAQPPAKKLGQPSLGDPADPVVRAAMDLIAGRVASMPPVYAADPADLKVSLPSRNTPAFRIYLGRWVCPEIFVNRLSITYKQAVGGDRCALKTLAGILVHEAIHSHTMDDKAASQAELETLAALIRQPTTGMDEQICLMDRQAAVRRYAGLR